ncbi:hypothetical protein ACMFMF_003999 [Clarireedia jacksonii]
MLPPDRAPGRAPKEGNPSTLLTPTPAPRQLMTASTSASTDDEEPSYDWNRYRAYGRPSIYKKEKEQEQEQQRIEEDWPEDPLKQHRITTQIPLRQPDLPFRNIDSKNDDYRLPPQEHKTSTAPNQAEIDEARNIMARNYKTDMKYSGRKDCFNQRLEIFYDQCDCVGVPEEGYRRAWEKLWITTTTTA